jgi:hypothetical protein
MGRELEVLRVRLLLAGAKHEFCDVLRSSQVRNRGAAEIHAVLGWSWKLMVDWCHQPEREAGCI